MQPTPKPKRAPRVQYPSHDVGYHVVEAALEVPTALHAKLHDTLDRCCELRELLRQARAHNGFAMRSVRAAGEKPTYLTKNDQYRAISALVAADRRFAGVHSQVLQDVADRLHKGQQAWLASLKKGYQGPRRGPLREVERKQYRSFTFTQYGTAVKIRQGRLFMSKLGDARLLGLRKLPGRVKTVTLVWKQGRWFAQFCCEVQTQHQRRRTAGDVAQLPDTGLDTGLGRIATLADGTMFAPAKPLKDALPKLKHAQRKMARQFDARKAAFAADCAAFKGAGHHGPLPKRNPAPLSNRLRAQIKVVAKLHTKVACTRKDQLRKVARYLEQHYRLVAVEEHGIKFMQGNRRTARAVSDVAPGLFKQLLRHALGDRYVPVANRRPGIGGNSQTCLCSTPVPKTLNERWHRCPACGLSADRDVVSANIAMELGFSACTLKNARDAGQAVLRRGAGKEEIGANALGLGWAPTAPTAEPAVKRQPRAERCSSCETSGAHATGEVKNLLCLPGAIPVCSVATRHEGGRGRRPRASGSLRL